MRLLLAAPPLLILSALFTVSYTGPGRFVPIGATFALSMVALVLAWTAVWPFLRLLRELPDSPQGAISGVPTGLVPALLRDIFRRKPAAGDR